MTVKVIESINFTLMVACTQKTTEHSFRINLNGDVKHMKLRCQTYLLNAPRGFSHTLLTPDKSARGEDTEMTADCTNGQT